MRPKFSFVIHGRNDNFGVYEEQGGPSFEYRIARAIESIRDQDYDQQQIEIIYVDGWEENPTPLPDLGVRVLPVSLAYIQKRFPKSRYPVSFYLNVGVREAQGEYIITQTADNIFRKDFVSQYLDYASSPSFICVASKRYTTCRLDFSGKTYWHGCSSAKEMFEALAQQDSPHDPFEAHPFDMAHDFHGMHRMRWEQLRGFDESMTDWGFIDQQLVYRAVQLMGLQCQNLSLLGAHMYHMDHKPVYLSVTTPLVENPRTVSHMAVNNENWGKCI